MDENTDNVPEQDVQPVEPTTPDSSAADQTAQETETQVKETPETGKEVPEVNRYAERARKAEREAEQLRAELEAKKSAQPQDPQTQMVKDQLKQLGFVTREEQQAELQAREQNSRLESDLGRLEAKYDGKDGRPKFDRLEVINFALDPRHPIGDPETAYEKLHQQEIIDWHVKQAIAGSRGVKTEASDGSGSQEVGTTDSDLKDGIAKGDRNALHTFLKRQTPKSW